jgi:integrase
MSHRFATSGLSRGHCDRNEVFAMTDDIVLRDLVKRANFFAGRSIAPATKRAYESDWAHFNKFCLEWNFESLPATPETVAMYLTNMADRKIAVSTIVRRCTSITAIHRASGSSSPCKDDRVNRVLSGIRRECGKPQQKAKPIHWDTLVSMLGKCDSLMFGIRDAALLSLGWCSALRRSEIVALDFGDIEFTAEGVILTVRRSKTDKAGNGQSVGIPRSNGPVCPVAALKRWIDRRGDNPEPNDPLFSKIGVSGRGKWWWPISGRLSPRMVSEIVKHYIGLVGLDQNLYSAHSLRRGLATDAGARGVPERVISRHTRHRSIETLRGYIEDGTIWAENPLPAIYASSSSSSSSN